ncbi:MAG: hypothetical protein WC831_02360 [Parcubacteria group bacterium]|jgi:hypothetical protein
MEKAENIFLKLKSRQQGDFFLLRALRELRSVILSGWKSYELEATVKMMRGEAPFNGVELQ